VASIKIGFDGPDPSFNGFMGSVSFRCRKEDLGWNNFQKNLNYFLAASAETKLVGMWHFDKFLQEDPLVADNTNYNDNKANPYNYLPTYPYNDGELTWDPVKKINLI
jgi:hypothetical protein